MNTALNEMTSYRDILRFEFETRAAKNARYSLRAYAKSIGVDVAHLSRILRGQKQLSMESAYLVAQRLFSGSREREYFLQLLALENASSSDRRDEAAKHLLKLRTKSIESRWNLLALEQFELMSNWYHIAILDLSTLRGFRLAPKSASEYLGIPVSEAKKAIERLERLGLLTNKNGKFTKTHLKLHTTNNVPSAALRSFHKQMIAKAADSLETQGVDRRYVVARTIALRRRELGELQRLVDEFLERVSQNVAGRDDADALYQLNVQYFDLKEGKET